MPKQHVVAEGECTSSIAFFYGFFADTVWNDPGNAELRSRRDDMNILAPGDQLTIPDKRIKEEVRNTGATHRFQRKGVPAKLRLQILHLGQPVANAGYVVMVGGQQLTGTTNDKGEIEISISPAAREATLIVGDGEDRREYSLKLGFLQPIEQLEGVQARLMNLAYDCSGEEGELGPKTRAALKAFQEKNGLEATGEIDDATRSKLKEAHDEESTGAPT